jgi:hypothetical protein
VKVSDQYNNGVSGVSVTFAAANSGTVNCGAGNAGSCNSSTNTAGIASATWTLGAGTGTQNMQATIASVPTQFVTFAATAGGCSLQAYTLGSTANGTLGAGDCGSTDSPVYYYDRYGFTTSGSTVARLTYKPTGYVGEMTHLFWPAAGLGFYYTGAAAGDSVTSFAILGAGTFETQVSTSAAAVTGSYQLMTQINPTIPSNWCYFDITKGGAHSHNVTSASCSYTSTNNLPTTSRSFRAYAILLGAGQSMTISMSGPLDNYIEVYDATTATTTFHSSANAAGTSGAETLNVTNGTASWRYYLIYATHALTGTGDGPKSGTYSLTIAP